MADPPARKRPCNCQKFDPAIKKLRQALLESLVDSYEAHVAEHGGKCRRTFVKGLVFGSVLLQAFNEMDRLGVTERGTDKGGKEYYPFALVDGHVSRIEQNFLVYINNPATRWGTGLGASYGTSSWQFHDDEHQNGTLKKAHAKEKSAFFEKKQEHRLPAEVRPAEVVLVCRNAIMNSFMDKA